MLLLRAKDLDDRRGQSHPFALREPCYACIYTAKTSQKVYSVLQSQRALPKPRLSPKMGYMELWVSLAMLVSIPQNFFVILRLLDWHANDLAVRCVNHNQNKRLPQKEA